MNSLQTSYERILVIDDSEELLDVLSLILARQGYTVIIKNSPDGIADFVQRNHIDLLLLDVILMGNNGRHVCRSLKSDHRTDYFPIILMSATPQLLLNLDECIADGRLEKPFDISLLLRKVENGLSKRSGIIN
jgi:DNA-binding response OmpR family regulator